MVDFITKDGKKIPLNRTPTGSNLASTDILPRTESSTDKERKSKRALKFAGRKAKQFAGRVRQGGEIVRREGIKRSIGQADETKRLDTEIDMILDDPNSSDSRKFRLLQRFGLLNRRRLSKQELKVVNDSLKELDERISKQRQGGRGGMTNPRTETIFPSPAPATEGLSPDQFNKLPEELKEQIRVQSLR